MGAFPDEFELEVLDAVVIEVVGDFSRAVYDVRKLIDLQKLVVLTYKAEYLRRGQRAQVQPVLYLGALEVVLHTNCGRYFIELLSNMHPHSNRQYYHHNTIIIYNTTNMDQSFYAFFTGIVVTL